MGKLIDLTGQRFGRLTVIERAHNTKDGRPKWNCLCDCGNLTVVRGKELRSGGTSSCGCLRVEKTVERSTIHGKRHTRLYRIWQGMVARCENPNADRFGRYGGRGIVVCDEWRKNFQMFYDWAMNNGYRDDLSIDRIDNNKGYYPNNCRWSTDKEQRRNKSTTHYVEYDGEKRSLMEWCEIYQVKYHKVKERLRLGWTIEEALELVPRKKI